MSAKAMGGTLDLESLDKKWMQLGARQDRFLTHSSCKDFASHTEDKRGAFERLPGEIRNKIYELLLSHETDEWRRVIEQQPRLRARGPFQPLSIRRKNDFCTEVFRLNKAISRESQDFFYGQNKFVVVSATNLVYELCTASEDIPRIITRHPGQSISHVLMKFRIAAAQPNNQNRLSVKTLPEVSNIMFSATYLKHFISCLRIALLTQRPKDGIHAHIILQPGSKYFGESSRTTELLLNPFSGLVRFTTVVVDGCTNKSYEEKLIHVMTSTPPFAPEAIKECERLRMSGNRFGKQGHYEAMLRAFLDGCSLAKKALVLCDKSSDMAIVDLPSIIKALVAVEVDFLAQLAFAELCNGDFRGSIKIGKLALRAVTNRAPDYPRNLKASVHFYIAEAHLCLAEQGKKIHELRDGEAPNVKQDTRSAWMHLAEAFRLDPENSTPRFLTFCKREGVRLLVYGMSEVYGKLGVSDIMQILENL
ncbi:hypothetical protein MMC11_000785 [Xylographa trunciseda]|nr:hypothetical protein [Xylographa trunciseda]